jgi:UDP-N-acetylmuramoylalanine--D-glutamate ligase
MINLKNFRDKKVGVLGLGKTGVSAMRAILQAGGVVVCWDDDKEKRDKLENGERSLKNLNDKNLIKGLDLLVVSPGIPHLYPNPHEVVNLAYKYNVKVENDIGLFFSNHIQADYETCINPPKILALTGSNGKSTATALANYMLSKVFSDVEMGGNIGRPVLELSNLTDGSIRILELSSYQIELAKCLAPNIAAFINFSSDHVQRHGGLGGYFYGKAKLFLENSADISIINIDSVEGLFLYQRLKSTDNKIIVISTYQDVKNFSWGVSLKGYFVVEWQKGKQVFSFDLRNLNDDSLLFLRESLIVVYALARSLGVAPKNILDKCIGFTPLQHRNQQIDIINGLKFINDSKATNIDATIHALKIHKNVHLIAGGQAKEDNFDELQNVIENVLGIYLFGEAAPLIAKSLDGYQVDQFDTLDQAFNDVTSKTRAGDTVLFSPACASFDQYANFEDRGKHFVSLVEEYRNKII